MEYFVFSVAPWDVSVCSDIFQDDSHAAKGRPVPRNEPHLSITGSSAQIFMRCCAPTNGVSWNRETSKLCFYTTLPGANVPYPYQLRLSDKSSRFMKLTFGKFDRKLKKLSDQDIARLHSPLNRKMWSLL
jgi:hypothetical protein